MSALVERIIQTPIAPLIVQASEQGLLLVEFGDTNRPDRFKLDIPPETPKKPGEAMTFVPEVIQAQSHIEHLEEELKKYFDGDLQEFKTPIILRGTPFQNAVWGELLRIPYGYTNSYDGIARKLGDEKKARAVGLANGRNCLAIIVPCHRVIRADGSLGGYGGGLWRKKRLLDLESGALRLL